MDSTIISRIVNELGKDNIIDALAELTGSDFNSFMLEVYNRRVNKITPQNLLKQYQLNRFVKPADIDPILLLKTEYATLAILQNLNFKPSQLSPLAVLGSCSVLGTVSQEKVVSAIRGTEVLADATNAMALHIADIKQKNPGSSAIDICTVQRHVRTQPLPSKEFTPHFLIGCLVSSGTDRGSYSFECDSLYRQITAWKAVLKEVFNIEILCIRLQQRKGYADNKGLIEHVSKFLVENLPGLDLNIQDNPSPNDYYKGLQFKIVIQLNKMEWEIADGGFVDWTQQLLGNKKDRLLISGIGLELLQRMTQ